MSNPRRFSVESLEDRTVPALATINPGNLLDLPDPNRHGTGNAQQVPVEMLDTGPNPNLTYTLGTDATSQFVQKLYADLLSRDADEGARPFVDAINSGQSNRRDVAEFILHSDEYARVQIDAAFQKYLSRHTDQSSLDGYAQQFKDGKSLDEITVEIVASDEYRQLHAGGAQLVTAIYQDVLGRQPDTTSAQAYTDRFANADGGATYNLVKEIVDSSEARTHRGALAVQQMFEHDPGESVTSKFVAKAQDQSLSDLLADLANSEHYLGMPSTTAGTGHEGMVM